MMSLTHKIWENYILEIQHETFADEIYEVDLLMRRIKKDLEFSCWCDCLIFYLDKTIGDVSLLRLSVLWEKNWFVVKHHFTECHFSLLSHCHCHCVGI